MIYCRGNSGQSAIGVLRSFRRYRIAKLEGPWQRTWCAFRDGAQPAELLQWGRRFGPARLLSITPGADQERIAFLMDTLLACHLAPAIHDRENICLSLLHAILLLVRSLDHHRHQTTDSVLLPALQAMRQHMDRSLRVRKEIKVADRAEILSILQGAKSEHIEYM